jgi:hypothetical protein
MSVWMIGELEGKRERVLFCLLEESAPHFGSFVFWNLHII